MPDIFDEIIDKLSPSTIRLILECNNHRRDQTTKVNNLLHDVQQIKIKYANKELSRKIHDINARTKENKDYLLKLQNELTVLKSLKKTPDNEHGVKAYTVKINELESKLMSLAKDHEDIDLTHLYNEVEDLNKQIKEYKQKISEAKSKYSSYDGFPPDIEQGKEVITKIKERIKQNEF